MHIGSHTLLIHPIAVSSSVVQMQHRRGLSITEGMCLPHVDLIALTIFALYLTGEFLTTHRGGDRQQTKSWEAFDISFHMIWITHLDTHQLITATDTQHRSSFPISLHDGLSTTISTQFVKVVQR